MGRSGKHVAKRTDVPRTEGEVSAWKRTAKLARADHLTSWIRATLNAECERMGVRVRETLDEPGEE